MTRHTNRRETMAANIWRDMGPELSVMAFLLIMGSALALTFVLTH
jgi:hypothetical protein